MISQNLSNFVISQIRFRDFVIPQIRFCNITNSIFWYRKIDLYIYIYKIRVILWYTQVAQFGASANVTHSNIFHQENLNCFYVSLYVETYKDLHDNNIWNWGLEFYVKIIRKTLISLKPKAPFPWTWHLKDRFNSNSCKNSRDIFWIN